MSSRTICSNCGAAGDGARYCTECGELATWHKRRSRTMLAGVAGVIVVLGVVFVVRSADPAPDAATPVVDTTTSPVVSTTTATNITIGPLQPSDVTCSSEIPGFPCHALIDGDPTTAWNTLGSGEGAEVSVEFEDTARVTAVVFHNIVDDASLTRNGRAREIRVNLTDSVAVATAELESGHGPYRISISPDPTTGLVIRIISTYPGEHYQGLEPFEELAMQEITFFGVASTP